MTTDINTAIKLENLEGRVKDLEVRLSQFVPVVVMLRLEDGKVHPVTLFAKVVNIEPHLTVVA